MPCRIVSTPAATTAGTPTPTEPATPVFDAGANSPRLKRFSRGAATFRRSMSSGEPKQSCVVIPHHPAHLDGKNKQSCGGEPTQTLLCAAPAAQARKAYRGCATERSGTPRAGCRRSWRFSSARHRSRAAPRRSRARCPASPPRRRCRSATRLSRSSSPRRVRPRTMGRPTAPRTTRSPPSTCRPATSPAKSRRRVSDRRTATTISRFLARRPLDEEAFRNEIASHLSGRVGSNRDVLVFVHGFNTGLDEARFRLAQIVHRRRLQRRPRCCSHGPRRGACSAMAPTARPRPPRATRWSGRSRISRAFRMSARSMCWPIRWGPGSRWRRFARTPSRAIPTSMATSATSSWRPPTSTSPCSGPRWPGSAPTPMSRSSPPRTTGH